MIVRKSHGFSLAQGKTKLDRSDYRFLERFLDVTKANLFFARGVMIVEGDAENLLIPTLAKIMGKDFTTYGVSIVNVGGVGLRRYARIFQRTDAVKDEELDVPVACVTDMDVMPNCAPLIIGKMKLGDDWPAIDTHRRWRAKRDIPDLQAYRNTRIDKASGQFVRTFVSDEWTFEYDLALGPKDANGVFTGGLSEDVYVAASLASKDDQITSKDFADEQLSLLDQHNVQTIEAQAVESFRELSSVSVGTTDCTIEEVIASEVYAKFVKANVSKAIAAQYLAERLQSQHRSGTLTSESLRSRLPKYLVDAIDYVTSMGTQAQSTS